ncbi:MAG TPA: cytochrome c biogenesis protein CcdA [Negativicutes bacterium]|jgi:cytochrome c-type biogenesis protein
MENQIALFTTFIAGMISFLSPCVLPVLPTYAALLAGTANNKGETVQWHFWLNAFCFLIGFTVVFIIMGATASYFGQLFLEYQESVRKIGALFMVVMGIHILGIIRVTVLHREYRPLLHSVFRGPFGAFMLGIAFTAGWTPCTGPILASILVYAGTATTLDQGALLLFIYAMGFSIPFLLAAFLMNRFSRLRVVYHWLPYIQQISGLVLIMAGIIIYFDLMQKGLGLFWSWFAW